MSLKKIIYVVVVLGFIGASIGITFFSGYAIGRYELRPFTLVQNIEGTPIRKLLERLSRKLESLSRMGRPSTQFESIFLSLNSESGTVPVERSGNGGGLTSFGDAVLLVTHEGKIFSARSAGEIEETAIEAPENGFSAYQRAAATERFSEYFHDFSRFRYNDILHYQSDSEQGLAVSYTEFDEANDCYRTALAVLVLDPNVQSVEQISASKDDWDIVYRTQPCLPLKKLYRAIEGHKAGGRITFGAPATIYLSSGDYHWDGVYGPEALAQDSSNDYGKVIAIDLVSRQAKIVSIGHRNMQGIVVDPNGQLWVVEHGVRGGDELNRIVEGANYGWPEETLGTRYNTLPWPNTRSYGRHNTFMAPTYAWLPSVAPSNLTVIEGFHDSWDGDLLVASLKERSLFRIRVKNERVLFAEKIKIGKRIRYVHQHNDGRVVLWTDDKYLIFLNCC